MEREISETLLGWQAAPTDGFEQFSLTEKERSMCVSLLSKYFSSTSKATIETLLKAKCEASVEPLSSESFSKIVSTCNAVLSGYGPLSLVLQQNVEEVYLSLGPVRVFIPGKGWSETPLVITSEKHLAHVVNKLATQCGRRLTADNPVLNAFLPDGTRIHAVCPPLAPAIQVSIRKFRAVPFTLPELVKEKILPRKAADFLLSQTASESILVVGNTGSGKTTTLNALLSTLPKNDRFVFVEDVSELTLPSHGHKARLLADGGVSLSQLTYEALRMRPDRLVVSEIRSEQEVKAFANALLSGGGKTCYSTFHSQSAEEALRRLELLGFRKADLDSLGLIVVQLRFDDKNGKETRKVTEIAKVKNGKAVKLYRYGKK